MSGNRHVSAAAARPLPGHRACRRRLQTFVRRRFEFATEYLFLNDFGAKRRKNHTRRFWIVVDKTCRIELAEDLLLIHSEVAVLAPSEKVLGKNRDVGGRI